MSEVTFDRSVFTLKELPRDGLPEICISGRSNVGKSSMINRLAGRRNLAKTSRTPGKTRSLNYYRVNGKFYLVDLPGYGYAKASGDDRRGFGDLVEGYLSSGRKELKGIIQLIDSRHGPVGGDHDMLAWIQGWTGRSLYVFTKADKLSSAMRSRIKHQYEKEFGVENIAVFSAHTGTGSDTVWSWMFETSLQNNPQKQGGNPASDRKD